jgi:small subunit ribosomal protein S8
MTNDLVSDMLVRIKNASFVKHSIVVIRFSKVNIAILKVLKKEGYIKDFHKLMKEDQKENQKDENAFKIKVFLKYKGWWIKKPFFSIFKRVSKPGRRIFSGYKNFQKKVSVLKYQQGIAIVSTSMGVMSHLKASKLQKGGEILCYIE